MTVSVFPNNSGVTMPARINFIFVLTLPILLAGCISFSSSEAPTPDYVDACSNREQQCQTICGKAGVQIYSCSAKPGEGISFKCECRKPGMSL